MWRIDPDIHSTCFHGCWKEGLVSNVVKKVNARLAAFSRDNHEGKSKCGALLKCAVGQLGSACHWSDQTTGSTKRCKGTRNTDGEKPAKFG